MMQGYTTTRALCDRLGVSRQAIFQRAQIRGLRPLRIGQSAVWTAAQAEVISRPLKGGRPPRRREDEKI
jgi:hypothetical protein